MDALKSKSVGEYIIKIAGGHKDSITSLFKNTVGNMREFADRYSCNQSNVDDIISELYMNVVKFANTFDQKRNGLNWMLGILKNVCYKYNNQDKALIDDIEDYYEDITLATSETEDLDIFISKEVMAELNEEELLYMNRLYVEGYTPKEVARLNNTPLSTVYSRIKAIFKKIKKFY